MPQSGGVVAPRARRRRPAPRAFGLDLEWEAGTARAEREPAHGRFDPSPSRRGTATGQRRLSGPVDRGGAGADTGPTPGALDDDAPWFAALPASLLAPADEPAAELTEPGDPATRREAGATAARTRRTERDLVDEELAALARPAGSAEPAAPAAEVETPGPDRTTARTAAAADWAPVYDPVTGRRTVTIRGRGADRVPSISADSPRRTRSAAPRHERSGFVADRAAMWAVLLGVLLVLIAVASAHG